ncbi:MAG: glycosyltransferase family 4 protein [Candidatus Omnitrophota bacterium]|jgi:glycosyltransferase involved in cell wall biosynthesis
MNILLIHPHDLYSPSEPWTIRIKKFAQEFMKAGHSVTLVYFPLDPRQANRTFRDNGIRIIALDRRLGIWRLARNILKMTELAGWADIIHFQKCYYYAALPALIAGLLRDKPVHYDWDDWETQIFYYSNPKYVFIGGFLDLFEKILPAAVSTVSVSSRYLRELCIARGAAAENVFIVPVGADLEEFTPGKNGGLVRKKYNVKDKLVMYVGQLHGGQYAELFIKSAKIITDCGSNDTTFMIVGDGYRLRELKCLARDLGVDKHCIFTASIPHQDVPHYMSEADVCVACFEDNGITRCKSPLKIAEYLASGKAIVASKVGEVENMLGGAGILVEAGRPEPLAEKISSVLSNESLRKEMGIKARRQAERTYNWRVSSETLLKAYENSLRHQGRV